MGAKHKLSRRQSLSLLVGAGACSLASCFPEIETLPSSALSSTPSPSPQRPLGGTGREAFRNNFKFGVALQARQVRDNHIEGQLAAQHFDSLTAEYEMKARTLAPAEGQYNWTPADDLVAFARTNKMNVRGHALLWHQSTPDWAVTGTPTQIRTKLETYIQDVLQRYQGQVGVWDVVNEVVTDNGSEASAPYRSSNWYNAVGKDYIDWAFQTARAADPNIKLFLNEYGTEWQGKRDRTLAIITDMLDRGIPLDGIGHQMHINLDVGASQVLDAINAVDGLFAGLENHITELDISLYNDPGTCWASGVNCRADYGASPPDHIIERQSNLLKDIFTILKSRSSVTSVTLWGLHDGQSWLNGLPAERTNYPLLFNRNLNPKSAYIEMVNSVY